MGNSNSGRGGLPRAKRREVERLIRAGAMKKAQIARECGVDVSTVSRYKRQLREAEGETSELATVRCGGCGGLVLVAVGHCVACLQRKTIFDPARRRLLARERGKRNQKARLAA